MLTIASFLIIILNGYFLAALFLRDPGFVPLGVTAHQTGEEPTRPAFRRSLRWVRFSLVPGLGIGLSSLVYFAWRVFFGPPNWTYLLFELAIILLFAAIYVRSDIRLHWRRRNISMQGYHRAWRLILPVTFFVAVAGLILVFIMGSAIFPHGFQDSWLAWNLGARFLYRGGEAWVQVFSPLLDQPDSPLLVASTVARLWTLMGGETTWVPQVVALIFALSLVGLLVSLVGALRGRLAGYTAGLLLLTASALVVLAPAQIADAPFALYLLAAMGLIYLYDVGYTHDKRALVLAGACSGLALWTKNDGWLFILALGVIHILRSRRQPNRVAVLQPATPFLLGLLPLLLFTLAFRVFFTPRHPLIAGIFDGSLANVLDINRYGRILTEFFYQLVSFDPKTMVSFLVLGVFLLFAGLEAGSLKRWENRSLLYLLLIISGGFLIALVLSPRDLEMLLQSTLFRFLLEIWPLFVFLSLQIARLPGVTRNWYQPPG